MNMKKYIILSVAALLAACGGKTDGEAAAQLAPKPVFRVKYIDTAALQGLALEQPENGQDEAGKPVADYLIADMEQPNHIRLTGKHSNDLEAISGKCLEAGKTDWQAQSVCRTLFEQLVANIAEDADKLSDYLIGHAGLQPQQSGSGYAAVQNGRYVLELDSEGRFTFRRRHY
ncbi:hypothetical protein ACOR62_06320 [Neisseria lisongii]|uniref:hypothetical protein n=1 Tax=Neisseria lisongii TaxID=2912188 RepID=UPI003530D468